MFGFKVKKLLAITLSAAMLFSGSVNTYAFERGSDAYAEEQAEAELEEAELEEGDEEIAEESTALEEKEVTEAEAEEIDGEEQEEEAAEAGDTDAYDWDGEKAEWSSSELGSASQIQSTTGSFSGIYVDASATGAKFKGNGTWAQVNVGTKLFIPAAKDTYYTAVIKAYHNKQANVYSIYTAEDTCVSECATTDKSTESQTNSFVCRPVYSETRERYEIELDMTVSDYLGSISLEEIEVPEKEAEDFDLDFNMGDSLPDGVSAVDIDTTNSAGHGLKASSASAKLYLNLKEGKKANIVIDGCEYGTASPITTNSGSIENNIPQVSGSTVSQWTISGANGLTAIFLANGMYMHGLSLTYLADETYDVKVNTNNADYGSAAAQVEKASEGEQVTLLCTPSDGCRLKEWKVDKGDVTVSNNKFTMPAEAVEITAVFEEMERHYVTVTVSGNGSASANCVSAWDGKEVELTAEADEGSIFKEWIVKSGSVEITSNKFTMPDERVEIIAVFEEKSLENSTVDEGTYSFGSPKIQAGAFDIKGISLEGIDGTNNSHGIYSNNTGDAAVMTVSLRQKANITVYTCGYCAGTGATLESSSGTISEPTTIDYCGCGKNGLKFVVLNALAGDLVLTFSNNTYIEAMSVEYVQEVSTRTQIDVWDFGGSVESDEKYNNLMTPEAIIESGIVSKKDGTTAGGLFTGTAGSFGDLKLFNTANDRLYTNVEALADYNNGTYAYAQTTAYGEEYQPEGAWYCNGTGSASRRYVTIANVQAGDKIAAYMGISQSGPSEMYFEGQGGADGQKDTVIAKAGEFQKYEFVAEKTGTYKIYENGSGKPMYHRIMRYPYVNVSGSIDFGSYSGEGHSVKFINQTTEQETEATLDGSSFTAHLAPGYDYVAVFEGAAGYGLTVSSNKLSTTDKESLTGKSGVKLVVEEKQQYAYAGSIKGFAEGYDISSLKMVFVPTQSGVADKVTAAIKNGNEFSVTLQDGISYDVELSGVNDYELKDETPICISAENTSAVIEVVTKAVYKVTGAFFGNDGNVPTSLSFKNLDDSYTYDAEITAEGYSIELRDGSYQALAELTGYSTQTHVIINGQDLEKDIMFVSTTAKENIARVSDIYVGYPDKENNYDSMRDAMEACSLMTPQPTSEADRITVHIAPGTYREQIIVTTPYVSFVNDSSQEVLLTWYYGIGYKYYSSNGYYDPERAYDKYEKKIADKWGVAVYVKSSASNFKAKNITFENSFNRYVTDEEIEDGVECDTLKVDRTVLDSKGVQSKAATERAAAMAIEAPFCEFKDCGFYSSQDTLYTADSCYFKDCVIEGQTDYIYGSGNCVFDTCTLSWKGYSANSLGGYITANRPESSSEEGYLFRNCVVTGNDSGIMTVSSGYFGRPWGPLAKVKFLNTQLEKASYIAAEGWYEMSGVKPQDVTFLEYNTTTYDGEAADVSGRISGTNAGVMTAEMAAAINVKDYFYDKTGSTAYTPEYYVEEEEELAFSSKPFITDNGDLNTPYPGHTLTVGYSFGSANDANDVSSIKWYSVKDGEETLLKTSNAVADKSYKIGSETVGSYIKVVVEPKLISGKTAESASCITDHQVLEGYEDPDNAGGDAVLGDGINVFLAGDSTVMDYSANGMNSSGNGRNEGSWGEFLQYFLSDKATVVDYAIGGRSSRSFINEGSLDKIAAKIGKGDYLFIQFGHNDCADQDQYLYERYCPLGTPDANGIYPVTAGVKVETPSELAGNKYGSTCYTFDCGGTYKWYLLQYINVAKEAGATPVLVTPVSRLMFDSTGKIKSHHDSSGTATKAVTTKTSNDAYVTAVKQLAEEENVLLLDGFALTKGVFEEAYASAGNDSLAKLLMNTGDNTHNNKLGGFVEAALFAEGIYDLKADGEHISLAYALKAPGKLKGVTTDGKTVVSLDDKGNVEAYSITDSYESRSSYWESWCEEKDKAIEEKAASLNGDDGDDGKDDGKDDSQDDDNQDEEIAQLIRTISENAAELAQKGYLTDKKSKGSIVAAPAVSENGHAADTAELEVFYEKGKAVKVTPKQNSGSFTVAAGTKITLPGVDPKDKYQTYVITATDGTVVNTANTKLKDKYVSLSKGLLTTKANKKCPEYEFAVSYQVNGVSYSYQVKALFIGFKKAYKKNALKATAWDGSEKTQVTLNLDGDLLKDGENTISSAVWMADKNQVLVPGKPCEIKKKDVVIATVTLSQDGRSVTIKTTGAQNNKGKAVTGAVKLTVFAHNSKKLTTSVKIAK